MIREEVKKLLPIIQAFAEGKTIECLKEEKWVENLALEAAMKKLSERERFIINLRFFEGRTQMEVADDIGISQAQVSRLEKNALKTMKLYLSEK